MKPILFDPEARDELRDAFAFYEGRHEGLGTELQAEVEAAVQRIATSPTAYPPCGARGVRRCRVNRFPYSIFYLELDTQIWIVAVAHQRRQPGYWEGRTLPANGSETEE